MSQMANGFAMNDGVSGVLKSIAGGLPGGAAQTMVRPWRFWHRVAYIAAGQVSLSFFNVGESNFVSNWKQAGQLPNNYGFALQSVGAKVYSGMDIAGAAAATGALSAVAGNTAAIVEQLRLIHECAKFTLEVNDKRVVDIMDITAIPPGRGMDVSACQSGAAAVSTIAAVNNSAPLWGNRHYFDTPWPISGGQTVTCRLDWNTIAPLTGGGVAMVEFIGLLISPAGL